MNSKNVSEEIAKLNPKWIEKYVPDSYADDDLKKIIIFYVINTPCTKTSSSGIPLSEYGWSKDGRKNNKLKTQLYDVAKLEKEKTIFVANNLKNMQSFFEMAKMQADFYKNREQEKIAYYQGKDDEILSILKHIRNSLAHGRLAMYPCEPNDVIFVLEDGIATTKNFKVRSRMIIKKSTLLKWIDIIKAGPQN